MGSVLAIMGAYYLLNGQVVRAAEPPKKLQSG